MIKPPLTLSKSETYTELRKNALVFREVLFQGIAASAPAGAAVATMTGAAAFALGALPLTALIAFVVVLLNAVIINRISSHVAGAGGYYEYVKQGFGPRAGVYTGWLYILYQMMSLGFIALSTGVFVPALLSSVFGINIPSYSWFPILVATAAFGYLISYLGIKGSLRYAMVMGTIEILVVVGIGLWIIIGHPSANTVLVFTPKYSTTGLSGAALGVLFMYTAFSGYGGSTPLGEEAQTPNRMIGRAVLLASIILGVFFVFAAYAFTIGWGPTQMGTYASALVPGITLAQQDIGTGAAVVLTVLFINSILTDAVVFTNSASRVTMQMARDGMLPKRVSSVHQTHRTPHIAGAVMVLASVIISSVAVVTIGGFNAFILTGTVATLAAVLVHSLVNASLPPILRRKKAGIGLLNILLPVVTIVILGFVFYGTYISISLPVIISSYIFGAWAIVGVVYAYRRKGALNGGRISSEQKTP